MALYHGDAETGMREECAVFGIVATGEWPCDLNLSHLIHLGLISLQHRGQESAGIVTTTGDPKSRFITRKAMGLVGSSFSQDDIKSLTGNLGIGHCRYSTQGLSEMSNIQPFVVESLRGLLAVAHNGELVNVNRLKQKLLKHGVGLSSTSDSEILTQLLTHTPDCGEPDGANWVGRIKKMMIETEASYSLVIMQSDRIWAVRDPYGNRPLCIGKLLPLDVFSTDNLVHSDECEAWVVSSESCAFTSIGAQYYRDVLPGQMVNSVRRRCGRQLACESPVDADLISTVPESATPAAMEYARTLGIPYLEVLCKNRYVGRTFIQPSTRLRKLGVMKKFGPLSENFNGKRLVLIDDSIVRGTTMAGVVSLLKQNGAKEVHIRVASPPVKYPCYMGINIPTREELIANQMSLDVMAQKFGADSVRYLSLDGLVKAVEEGLADRKEAVGHCTACLSGDYPLEKLDW